MELQPRDTQTQVKHKILSKYLGAWGGIILNGLSGPAGKMKRRGNRLKAHFVYVDCFSHVGKYSGDTEKIFLDSTTGPVIGSPIIGVKSLDDLLKTFSDRINKAVYGYDNIDLTVNAILIEKNQRYFANLLQNLSDEGFGSRIRETTNFLSLESGQIAVVNNDSVALVDELLAYTIQPYTWAFYLLDPYGPSGIPHDFVKPIVQKDKHDVMINFVYFDLEKKTGSIEASSQQSHVAYWTKAFGDERWIEIKKEIESHRDSRDYLLNAMGMTEKEAELDPILFEKTWGSQLLTDKQLTELTERRLVDLYKTVLMQMDPTLAVKTVKLHFSDKDRTMFYLFLTTHDGTGALKLNEILYNAEFWEKELRYIYRAAKKQLPPPGQLSFLEPIEPEVPEFEKPDRPSKEECAEEVMRRFSGRVATRRDVYKELADEIYFEAEVKKSITFLKRERRVKYSGKMTNDTEIHFLQD